MSETAPLLELKSLEKRYGSVVVADSVSLSVPRGTCFGVVGPNGAGKTSLFHMIAGTVRPNGGRIFFEGRDITDVPAHARVSLGIMRAFQIPQPFPHLTVYENALMAACYGGGMRGAAAESWCVEVLSRLDLLAKAEMPAGQLLLLDRKRLELAKAVASRAKLLLLDEIAGGLTEPECHELVAVINGIRARGVTIVWIEHVVHALLAVVDRIAVIDFGRKIADGAPREVLSSPAVAEIYMGPAEEAA